MKHPSTMLVAGPSQAGKSVFVKKLIEGDVYTPRPKKVIYCYSVWNDAFARMNASFVKGFPKIEDIKNSLLVLDDLMSRINETIVEIFTKHSHHLNCSVVFIVQNLFYQNKLMRTISLNTHYIVLFKNPRDVGQIDYLARQISPGNKTYVREAYKDATSRSYGYLLIDLRPETPEHLRLKTKFYLKNYLQLCTFQMDSYMSALVRAKGKEQRRALLNVCSPSVLNKIMKCASDTLKGNVHLTSNQIRRLQPFRKQFRTLADRKVPKTLKKRILIQSGGSILPTIFEPYKGAFGRRNRSFWQLE